MKKCPVCKSVYSDDTLSFCLSDGTPLIGAGNAEETVRMQILPTSASLPPADTGQRHTENTASTMKPPGLKSRGGVSKIWIFATVALFSILVGVLAFFLLFGGLKTDGISEISTNRQNTAVAIQSNQQPVNIPSTNNPNDVLSQTPANSSPRVPITPAPQQTYRVIRVSEGDVLHIRPAPGNLKVSLAQIPPGTAGIYVTGGAVRVGRTFWLPIRYNGISGWVNRSFLSAE
ncbi:MAG TPA: hypothetical protein DEA22_14055 [Blastocatellia bacterium]|nr:hypothetical protein [Blastocatellia bacterium]